MSQKDIFGWNRLGWVRQRNGLNRFCGIKAKSVEIIEIRIEAGVGPFKSL